MAATMELRPERDETGRQAALPPRRRGRHQKTGRVHRAVKPGAAARLPARRETRSTAYAQPQAVPGVAAVLLPPAHGCVAMPFVDSHCHLNFPKLAENMADVLAHMRHNDVAGALCVSVNLADFPQVLALAEQHQNIYASVGVHPDYEGVEEPNAARLAELARHPRVIAIGETGLDYFRLKGDLEWQRTRFRNHIR